MTTLPLDDRQRKARNILFSSFVFLIVIWIFKFSHPQFTIIPSSSLSSSPVPGPIATATEESPNTIQHDQSHPPPVPIPNHAPPPSQPKPQSPAPKGAAGILSSSNLKLSTLAAVIIQPTYRANIIPLILHFSAVLGPNWPILIYTTETSLPLFSSSSSLTRLIASQNLEIRLLPPTATFKTPESISSFLTNTWIWDTLAPVENVLIFESDSILCANAAVRVEDYLKYSFIGAPIKPSLGQGYNGGLSLRKRSDMLRVLRRWDWEQTRNEGDKKDQYEDQWFYNRLRELQDSDQAAGVREGRVVLPSVEVARTFSVESVEYPHPLGLHQVHRFLTGELKALEEWCPEYKLCSLDLW